MSLISSGGPSWNETLRSAIGGAGVGLKRSGLARGLPGRAGLGGAVFSASRSSSREKVLVNEFWICIVSIHVSTPSVHITTSSSVALVARLVSLCWSRRLTREIVPFLVAVNLLSDIANPFVDSRLSLKKPLRMFSRMTGRSSRGRLSLIALFTWLSDQPSRKLRSGEA